MVVVCVCVCGWVGGGANCPESGEEDLSAGSCSIATNFINSNV